tara:strand:+ start:3223 stop:3342 length:120 start_codon:yes stop_codon:yes gene_type:complete
MDLFLDGTGKKNRKMKIERFFLKTAQLSANERNLAQLFI